MEITRKNEKETENFLYPIKFRKVHLLNSQLNPVETKRIDASDEVRSTVIYKYSNNGLPVGMAEYSGEVKKESGDKDFDILDNDKQNKKSGLICIIKYSYKYY